MRRMQQGIGENTLHPFTKGAPLESHTASSRLCCARTTQHSKQVNLYAALRLSTCLAGLKPARSFSTPKLEIITKFVCFSVRPDRGPKGPSRGIRIF